MAAGEQRIGNCSTDLSEGFILRGWAVETTKSNPCTRNINKINNGKEKEGLKPKTNATQSKYHGYWEKEELCFAFKHFQESDKYIEQYRQEKFRVQENYYKDALNKVRRQNSVLDDFITNQTSYGVALENSDKVNMERDTINSSNYAGQSASIHKPKSTGNNAGTDDSQSSLIKSFQGGMRNKGPRLKTGLLWKRSMSDPSLRAHFNADKLESQSNWAIVGVEKCPINPPDAIRKTFCRSAPPKNSLARFNSLRSYASLQATSKTSSTGRKIHSNQGRKKSLEINTVKPDLSAIHEKDVLNSTGKQSLELNRTKVVHTPQGKETLQNRRPVVTMHNLGDTLVTGVGVGGMDSACKSSKALPKRGSLRSNKDRGQLGYISSKSNYTDLFKNVINQYNEKTIEMESKLLSIKNF